MSRRSPSSSSTSASTSAATSASTSAATSASTTAATDERWTAVRVEELEQLRAAAARSMTPAHYGGAALATVVSMVAQTYGNAWTVAVLEHLIIDLRGRPDPST